MTTWRVYFNRKREAPDVFSIDEGDQTSEINVQGAEGHGCDWEFNYNGEKVNDDSPSAWMTIKAEVMIVKHGTAHFFQSSLQKDAWLEIMPSKRGQKSLF